MRRTVGIIGGRNAATGIGDIIVLVARIGGGKLWALLLKGRLEQRLEEPEQPALGGWLPPREWYADCSLANDSRKSLSTMISAKSLSFLRCTIMDSGSVA